MRAVTVAMLACFVCSVKAGEPDWTYVRSDNFELYTTAGQKDAKKTIEYFEQVRDFFSRISSSRLSTRLPVTIVAFANRSQFKPYSVNEFAAAYYQGHRDHDYIVMSGTGPDHFPVAVHEYMHLLIRHSGMHFPLWLNEGLAELYSTLQPYGGKVLVGAVPRGRGDVLVRENWLPIRRLLEAGHTSAEYNNRDHAGVFYAQSWLLTHMLFMDARFRPQFGKFLAAIAQATTIEGAFQQVYGVTPEEVEKHLRAYMRSPLQGAFFDTKLQKIESVTPVPADPVNVEIALATLVGFRGQEKEATSRLEKLVAANPNDYRVHEALALLAWHRADIHGAKRHYRRAIELNTPNWKTWWDYARVLPGGDGDSDTAILALRKVLELQPEHREARVLLAEWYLTANKHDEALDTLKSLKQIDRDLAARVFLAQAVAHANSDRDDEARKAVEQARKWSKEPHHTARADDLIRFLDVRARLRAEGATVAYAPRPAVVIEDEDPVPSPEQGKVIEATPVPPKNPTLSATGAFKHLDCLGASAVVHVATRDGLKKLLIRDPSRISIVGQNASMTLTCGPQPPGRIVTVEYIAGADKESGSVGFVRSVAFGNKLE